VGHQEHGNDSEQTHDKQNTVTRTHHSPLRAKVQAARRSFAENNEEENNLVRMTMLFQSAVTAKPHDLAVTDVRSYRQTRRSG